MICKLVEDLLYENETGDKIGDDDLIHIMRDYFDNRCFGSIELLAA